MISVDVLEYKFNKDKRYLTRGVNSDIPLELQILLWNMIDSLISSTKVKLDYLQVFDFDYHDNHFVITHTQEVPQYKRVHKIGMNTKYTPLINRKVFVIDDIDHCTMLFSNEY